VLSVSASEITLELAPVAISNGDLVTHFVLYMQTGFESQPQLLREYPISEREITLEAVSEALEAGTHYFFHYTYRNGEGDSGPSHSTEVALADYPVAVAPALKNDLKSSLTSISVEWLDVPFTQVAVLGYEVWMDQSDGLFVKVFDGLNKPGILSYTANGLHTGKAYQFKLRALNFNGAGPFSTPATFYTCLPPELIKPVQYVSSTSNTLTV
jgi:hypothetical protein